jgi:hypothetical protein
MDTRSQAQTDTRFNKGETLFLRDNRDPFDTRVTFESYEGEGTALVVRLGRPLRVKLSQLRRSISALR